MTSPSSASRSSRPAALRAADRTARTPPSPAPRRRRQPGGLRRGARRRRAERRPGALRRRSAASAPTSSSPATRRACPTRGAWSNYSGRLQPTRTSGTTPSTRWSSRRSPPSIAVGAGVMAAYPLARYRFRFREPLFMVFVLGLLFPLATAIIPLFIFISRDLQLSNTWWGVALPQAAFALPVTVVILRPVPDGAAPGARGRRADRRRLPGRRLLADRAAAERARADHRRRAGVRRRRGTPTCCRCCCCRTTCAPCRSGVADYSTEHSADTAGVLAFTSVAMLPALVLFLALQGRIVNGLQGAVKG